MDTLGGAHDAAVQMIDTLLPKDVDTLLPKDTERIMQRTSDSRD